MMKNTKRHSLLVRLVIGRLCIPIATMFLLVLNAPHAYSTDCYWKAVIGDWSTGLNWNPAEPTSNDNGYIQNGGTVIITNTGEAANRVYLGASIGTSSGSGTINMTNGDLTVFLLTLGYYGSNGVYNLSGSGTLTATDENIGESGGSGTFTQTGGTHMILQSFYIGVNAGATCSYNLSGSGVLSAASEYIGYSSTATFSHTGGTNTTPALTIGTNGTYKFGAGTMNINGSLVNGGTYTFSGGTLNINGGYMGNGVIDMASGAGVIDASSVICDFSSGTPINTQNATINVDSHSLVIVPYGKGATFPNSFANYSNAGILHETGTLLTVGATQTISGTGTITDHVNCEGSLSATSGQYINLSGGLAAGVKSAVNLGTGYLYVNDATSGLNGGSVLASSEYIGYSGTGIFNHTGGTNTLPPGTSGATGGLFLGYNPNSNGTYILSGTSVLSAGYEYVGYSGAGTFTQTSGTNTISSTTFGSAVLCLGGASGSSGTYNLSGTGGLSAWEEIIGNKGMSAFTQCGGTNTISSDLKVGYFSGTTGTYDLSETGNLSTGTEYIGYGGKGTITQSGGINTAAALLFGFNTSGNGTYYLNGGMLVLHAMSKQYGTATFNFGGGTLQANGAFSTSLPMNLTATGGNAQVDTSTYAVTFSGVLSGSGGLNKLGAGVLTLSGNNSYLDDTTVSAGTLKVANTAGSATGSGAVAINSGAALSGSGSIAGPLAVAGTLSPGSSLGILTVNNTVTFQPGSTFNADVIGLTVGSGYDQLTTTGSVSLAGTLNMTFGTFTPTGHDILFLINNTGNGATTGAFQYANNAKIGTFNGFNWYITYEANNSVSPSLYGGNDVAIYSVAVPEPTTFVLLAAALLSLLTLVRRKTKIR